MIKLIEYLDAHGLGTFLTNLKKNFLGKNAKASSAYIADTLSNSKSIHVNLVSTKAAEFNGSADITPGVTGTLPVANGGTGQTSLANVTVGAATKATRDYNGNDISETYATKVEAICTIEKTASGYVFKNGKGTIIETIPLIE